MFFSLDLFCGSFRQLQGCLGEQPRQRALALEGGTGGTAGFYDALVWEIPSFHGKLWENHRSEWI